MRASDVLTSSAQALLLIRKVGGMPVGWILVTMWDAGGGIWGTNVICDLFIVDT
jgi:hypothetical protein